MGKMMSSLFNDKVVTAYFPLSYFVLAFVGALTMDAMGYYLYVSGETPLSVGIVIGLAYLPWAIKPLKAFIQDWFGKYGNWTFVSALLSAGTIMVLALMFEWGDVTYSALVLVVALCSLGRVSMDVAVDGWAVHLTRDGGEEKLRSWMEAAGFVGGIVGFPLIILALGDNPGDRWWPILAGASFVVLFLGALPLVIFKYRFQFYEEKKGRTQIDWGDLWQWIKSVKWLFVFGFVSSLTFAVGKVLGLPWLLSLGYNPTQIAYFLIGNFVFGAFGAYMAGRGKPEEMGLVYAVIFLGVAYLTLGLTGFTKIWTMPSTLFWFIALTGMADGLFLGTIGVFFTSVSQGAGPNGPATKFSILIASTNLSAAIFAILTGLIFTTYKEHISYQAIWIVAGVVPVCLYSVVAFKLRDDPASI